MSGQAPNPTTPSVIGWTPKARVSEGEYLRVVLDVYGYLNTVRRCVVAVTDAFKVGLGLHQL